MVPLDGLAAGVIGHGQVRAPIGERARQGRPHAASARDQHDLVPERALRGHRRLLRIRSDPVPGNVRDPGPMVESTGQDEEEIAEAVEVDDQGGGHVTPRLSGEPDDQPFGAATDGPGQVNLGGRPAASRQDEGRQRGEIRLQGVDARLEPGRVLEPGWCCDSVPSGRGRPGPIRPRRARSGAPRSADPRPRPAPRRGPVRALHSTHQSCRTPRCGCRPWESVGFPAVR